MKKIIFLFTMLFSINLFSQPIEVPSDADSLRVVIGEVKTVNVVSADTTIVTNTDNEEYILVGENVGQLVSTLLTGIAAVRDKVAQTEGRPVDWIMEILKWLLGGSLTSVIAFGGRTISGVKTIFAKVAKNRRLVIGIAGAVSFGWGLIQGGSIAMPDFWILWAGQWFTFSMFAIGLYETVFSKLFGKTPKTESEGLAELEKAASLLRASGVEVGEVK